MSEHSRKFLRIHGVISKTGLPKPTLYKAIAQGRFPRPYSIGPRAVAWLEDEIDVWIQSKIDSQSPSKTPHQLHLARLAAQRRKP
jgi:prophage regulatory protein